MKRSTADPSISEQPESKTGIPRNRLIERSQADPSPPIETIPERLFIREQMSVCFLVPKDGELPNLKSQKLEP
ncbi:hypothetical protein, partial [Porphyromonas gingivalis]